MATDSRKEPPTLTAEEARQGRIVLNTPWRRRVFFGGLIAFVLLAVFLGLIWP